jgi:hypothetical protein
MTSFLTTGGIRGGSEKIDKFQPEVLIWVFLAKHLRHQKDLEILGEDPDLSIRLWELGFETKLIPTAYVYHERIDWKVFVASQ